MRERERGARRGGGELRGGRRGGGGGGSRVHTSMCVGKCVHACMSLQGRGWVSKEKWVEARRNVDLRSQVEFGVTGCHS